MAANKEQIENWAKGSHWNSKKAKRDMSKLKRRQAKKKLDEADKRNRYKGWTS